MEHPIERMKREDGWDQFSQSSDKSVELISLYKENKGRGILSQQYSLQPDMYTGWMPKLPSCPIPLTYQNATINTVLLKIENSDLYRIVYRGPRVINSVQLHKRGKYNWRYRQKYDLKVNAIEEAVNNVGKEEQKIGGVVRMMSQTQQSEVCFDSDFESGNLDVAVRVKKNEYDCFIRSDTNTKGHTNWYYFKVCNNRQVGTVQFNICNIIKQKNLYGKGMTPYSYEVIEGRSDGPNEYLRWQQNKCFEVQFVQRLCRYGSNKTALQLQFKYDFRAQNMEVYFAYSIPYTYTFLQRFLLELRPNPKVKQTSLGQSFSGLDIPLITISKDNHAKSNVIIAARIHPGQTNSSHMVEGFIKFLLEENETASLLLSCCNFHIIPMINPDGVVAGNYRTSFSGRDLNRKFDQIGKHLYPEINGLIALIKKLKSQRKKVQFFFDFHSHSAKKDLFCYGPEHSESNIYYLRSKLFAKLLQRQDEMFNYKKCIYTISQHKKFTARAHMLKRQGIPMTFTFEVSNGIYTLARNVQESYDRKSLLRAGRVIANGFAQYISYFYKEYYNGKNKNKIQNSRLSFPHNRKNSHYRKSVCFMRTQSNAHCDMKGNCQLDVLIQDILQEKGTKQVENEKGSDSEESIDDMNDKQIDDLLEQKQRFPIETKIDHSHHVQHKRKSRKMTLKSLTNKRQILKRPNASSQKEVRLQALQRKNQNAVSVLKQKKNKVYYEQTHPPTSKKIYDNYFQSKKALKQKKFPILF